MNRIQWLVECAGLIAVVLAFELYAALAGDQGMP